MVTRGVAGLVGDHAIDCTKLKTPSLNISLLPLRADLDAFFSSLCLYNVYVIPCLSYRDSWRLKRDCDPLFARLGDNGQ